MSLSKAEHTNLKSSGPMPSRRSGSFGRYLANQLHDVAAHLLICALLEAQAARVNRRQTDAIALEADFAEKLSNLVAAEDQRHFRFGRGPDHFEDRPLAFEGLLVEELDTAQGDGDTGARPLLEVLDVKEIVAQFFFGDLVRRLVVMLGELAYGTDLHLLCALGQAGKLQVFDQAAAQLDRRAEFGLGRDGMAPLGDSGS